MSAVQQQCVFAGVNEVQDVLRSMCASGAMQKLQLYVLAAPCRHIHGAKQHVRAQ